LPVIRLRNAASSGETVASKTSPRGLPACGAWADPGAGADAAPSASADARTTIAGVIAPIAGL